MDSKPPKVALGPETGTVKVTVTPLTGLLPLSLTLACSGDANNEFTVVLCGVPAVAVIEAGAPAVLLSEKLAATGAPGVVAVTT